MNSRRKTINPTLSDQEWRRVFQIVEKAAALPSDEQRDYVRRATEGRPDLEREALQFLKESGPSEFLETPIGPKATTVLLQEELKPGSHIQDFIIREELGRGAFATVYLAHQVSLDREVALKVSRFQHDEAKTIAKMDHENIIQVYSVTNLPHPPVQLICMQFVPSLDLERLMNHLPENGTRATAVVDVVDRQALSAPRLNIRGMELRTELSGLSFAQGVALIGIQLAEALEYAHQKKLLHLDIKPANILINHFGQAYLTDFNISSSLEALQSTVPKNFGGTAHYMPPEQQEVFTAEDKQEALRHIDVRADVFSLGRVLKVFLDKAAPSTERDSLLKVIRQASRKLPHERYESADAFKKALENWLETSKTVSRLPRPTRTESWIAEHPLLSLVGLGALPQIAATAVAIAYNSSQIVSHLNPIQQQTFHSLNLVYNPVVSLFALGIWLHQVWRLRLFLVNGEGEVDTTRRHLLQLPLWGILVSTLGWVPGAAVFPLSLYLRGGEFPLPLLGHLLLSFTFSYLIALSYTYFLHQWTVLLLYRHFWNGSQFPPSHASQELAPLPRRLLGFCLSTGLIPLLGASILLFSGPMGIETADDSFRYLVAALIALGVVGVFFAMTLYQRLSRFAYTWGVKP